MYRIVVFILFAFASVTQGLLPKVRHPQEALPDDVELSGPPALSKRGQHQPPDGPENGPELYSGLLSVKCQSPHCCRTIGLNPDVPQYLYYPNDPIPQRNNLQITQFPGHLTKDTFTYDPKDYHFYVNSTPVLSVEWEDHQLSLGECPSLFYIDGDGTVFYEEDYDEMRSKRDVDWSPYYYAGPTPSYNTTTFKPRGCGPTSEKEVRYTIFDKEGAEDWPTCKIKIYFLEDNDC